MAKLTARLDRLARRMQPEPQYRIFVRNAGERWHMDGEPTAETPGAGDLAVEIEHVDAMESELHTQKKGIDR